MKLVHHSLKHFICPDRVFIDLDTSSKENFLSALTQRTCERVDALESSGLYKKIIERESQQSTGVGKGVAFPHCRLDSIDDVIVSVSICHDGVDYGSPDNEPVKYVFLVVGPEGKSEEYLFVLSHIARIMSSRAFRESLLNCLSAENICGHFYHADSK